MIDTLLRDVVAVATLGGWQRHLVPSREQSEWMMGEALRGLSFGLAGRRV